MHFASSASPKFRIEDSRDKKIKSRLFGLLSLFLIVFATAVHAATIRVPQDAPTIQLGIDAAVNGDTVVVAPGIYFENINFRGKAITVTSEQGADVTIIDGRTLSSVVTFTSGETRSSVLNAFTLQNGRSSLFGAGVNIEFSSPTVTGNTIRRNTGCVAGMGVSIFTGDPLIQGNTITENTSSVLCGGHGGGIAIMFHSNPEILDNVISANILPFPGFGGGISLFSAGNARIQGNWITGNRVLTGSSTCGVGGGGISIANANQAFIVQNVITDNTALCGGGIYWSGAGGGGLSTFLNNTIADNHAATGSQLYTFVLDDRGLLINNIIASKPGETAVFCAPSQASHPAFRFNNIFTPQGSAYSGICPDQTSLNGNISSDPLFVDRINNDYSLAFGSPSIDVGSNSIAGLPALDFDDNPRILDGDGSGNAIVDMGAYEFADIVANAGSDQTISAAANCMATALLDGGRSFDPDGDQLIFIWTGPFGTVTGPTPSVSLTRGKHVITLTVSDSSGNSASDTVVVTVVDTTAPMILTATANPTVLKQANHQLVPINIDVSVSDNCDLTASCRIISVASNEAVEGLGDGDTSPDWVITGGLTLQLRAERSAHGKGRVYTITVECTDTSANTSTRSVNVTVPRNN